MNINELSEEQFQLLINSYFYLKTLNSTRKIFYYRDINENTFKLITINENTFETEDFTLDSLNGDVESYFICKGLFYLNEEKVFKILFSLNEDSNFIYQNQTTLENETDMQAFLSNKEIFCLYSYDKSYNLYDTEIVLNLKDDDGSSLEDLSYLENKIYELTKIGREYIQFIGIKNIISDYSNIINTEYYIFPIQIIISKNRKPLKGFSSAPGGKGNIYLDNNLNILKDLSRLANNVLYAFYGQIGVPDSDAEIDALQGIKAVRVGPYIKKEETHEEYYKIEIPSHAKQFYIEEGILQLRNALIEQGIDNNGDEIIQISYHTPFEGEYQ